MAEPKPATLRTRASAWRLPGVWLVPAMAAVIALYLFYRSYSERGPEITISFNTAEGISSGQTQIKYKAVTLGVVTGVQLDPDAKRVEVHAHMTKEAGPYLTDHTRFWVVRPRISSGSISGVETIISGAYIQCDPGEMDDGKGQRQFKGLEEPPGVRSDEPGKTYVLQADRIGSISMGSPIYFRDIDVGEVLSYDLGDGFGPIKLTIFVRSPYDKFIHPDSRFWNASGFWFTAGATGFHVQLQSLQSVLAGGINFETPVEGKNGPPATEKTLFRLFPDQEAAEASTIHERIPFVTYFQSSVKNLGVGAPVSVFGLRVGTVTGVTLLMDEKTANARVRVTYEIEPERIFSDLKSEPTNPITFTKRLVQRGLRAKLNSENIFTGQKSIALEFATNPRPVEFTMEGQTMVMPSMAAGGIDGLSQIPFAQIGENLNNLLAHADQTIGGPDMQNALHALAATLKEAQDLVQKTDRGLTPALAQLPQISEQLQQAVTHANGTLASVDQHSDFQRDARRTLEQVNDAAHSIQLLVDFLNRHPEALIRGRDIKEAP